MFSMYSKEFEIKNKFIAASMRNINYTFVSHWHDYFEIEYIISGSGDYFIDGKRFAVCPDILFFTSPMSFHRVWLNNAEIFNISFDLSIADEKLISKIISSGENSFDFHKKSSLATALIKELCENFEDIEYSKALLNCLLTKLCKMCGNEQNTKIQSAELYILENFRGPLTLETAAENAGLTPSYFSALFKSKTGMGFKKYLNNLRLSYAKKLLTFTDLPITQVCLESGFNDSASFIRRFGISVGCTPTEYRKSSRK